MAGAGLGGRVLFSTSAPQNERIFLTLYRTLRRLNNNPGQRGCSRSTKSSSKRLVELHAGSVYKYRPRKNLVEPF